MGTLRTCLRLARHAARGERLRDKKLVFLCGALGVMGAHRAALQTRFLARIGREARDGQVTLRLRVAGRPVSLGLRENNRADYQVAGELASGRYLLPPHLRRRPTAIVDGGANIGIFSLSAWAQFPDLPLICYEPDAANFAQLQRNLAANGVAAQLVPKALWSRTAELFFHPSQSDAGWVGEEPSPHPISCVTPEIPEGCWLKLDIEGAEYEVLPMVLRGATRPSLISMEIHFYDRRGAPLVRLMEEAGYDVHGERAPTSVCVNVHALRRDCR